MSMKWIALAGLVCFSAGAIASEKVKRPAGAKAAKKNYSQTQNEWMNNVARDAREGKINGGNWPGIMRTFPSR
jgi:hypothetical protein